MRYKSISLLPLLAPLTSYPKPATSKAIAASTEIQEEELPSSAATITTIHPIASPTPSPPTAQEASPPPLLLQRNQHTVALAARTTSSPSFATAITPVPLPVPIPTTGTDINDSSIPSTLHDGTTQEGEEEGQDPSSPTTTTITITRSNGTTTIRPTLTVTSLFSTVEPTTSGAGAEAKTRSSGRFAGSAPLALCVMPPYVSHTYAAALFSAFLRFSSYY